MKKISREEYIREICDLMKSDGDGSLEFVDINDDEAIYKVAQSFFWRDPDTNYTVKQLSLFFRYLNYEDFEEVYKFAKNYFEKKYNDEIELPQFINDKKAFLTKNYHLNKENMPNLSEYFLFSKDHFFAEDFNKACLEYNGSDFDLDDFLSWITDLSNKANKWFDDNKRDFIYPWEIKLIFPDLWIKRIYKNISYASSSEPYGTLSKDGDPVLLELENNYKYISEMLKTKNEMDFSLLLWTVYKSYHYFRNLSYENVIPKRSLCLFDCIVDLEKQLNDNPRDFGYVERPTRFYGDWYIIEVSTQLVYDLLSCIYNNFPSYYYEAPLFLGESLIQPAGGSEGCADMSHFESFLSHLNEYSMWFWHALKLEDNNGVTIEHTPDDLRYFLTDKIKVERDYEKLKEKVNDYFKNS